VLGFVEHGPVHVHNSAVYLENGQPVHVQRKAFLPTYGRFEEHKHFRPGQGLRAFNTRSSRVALLICNDAWQPPLPFLAVQDGAQALIVPASSGIDPAAPTTTEVEGDWNELLRFHARFLETYVVFVNRVGSETGVKFWGGSRIVDPWGEVILQAPRYEPAIVTANLDLRAVRRCRREMPLVKEARLDMLAREFARLLEDEP
jgi:predicted amidohydrolase